MTETFSSRVEHRLSALNMAPERAALLADLDRSTLRKVLERGGGMRSDNIAKLANVLHTTPAWLLEGTGPEVISDESVTPKQNQISEIDMRAGAGGGGIAAELLNVTDNGISIALEAVAAKWEFPETFLRGELRVQPSKAWIVEIMGDSGYNPDSPGAPGSLFPGDRIIVDTADRRPSPPGLFAVFDGNGLVVKMVEIVHGSEPTRLRLSSRNPGYSSYEVTVEEAQVIGRVRGRISAM